MNQDRKAGVFSGLSACKKGLAAAVSAVMALTCQIAYSRQIVTSSETIELNQIIQALPEDETAIEIHNPSGKSVLLIEGVVLNPDTDGNAQSAVRYIGPSSGFLLWLGPKGEIRGEGQADGILIDAGQEPDSENPQAVNFGILRLEGEVHSARGAAIRIKEPVTGVIEVGANARLSGSVAIVAEGNGGLSDFSWFSISGEVTGYSGIAIDFSDANNRLLLQVYDGRIEGGIVGTSTANVVDIIGLRGGAVGDISGVEQIIVYDDGKNVNDAPVLKGNILQGSSIERPDLFLEGPLKTGNDSTTAQTLEVDIQQSGNGRLIISLPENAETRASVVVTGQVDFGTSPAIQVVPTGETYTDLLNGESPATYKVIEIKGGLTSGTEQNIEIYTSPLITLEEIVSPGSDDVLEVKVTASPSEVLEKTIEQAGGGESSGAAISTLLDRVVEMLGSSDQALIDEAEPLYNLIASIPREEAVTLVKLARESRINGGMALEVDDVARRKAMLQITHRLRSLSYGDSIESRGFWLQLLKSDAYKKNSRNSNNDRIFGYELDVSGITLGLEKERDAWIYGGAITLATADTRKQDSTDFSESNNYQFSLYGSWQYKDWFVDGVANISVSNHDRTRYIEGFFDTPVKASYDSQVAGFQIMTGKSLQWQDYTLEPMVGINYTYLHSDSYKEEDTGRTGLAQAVASNSLQKIELGAGLLVKRNWIFRSAGLEPGLQLMFWHDLKGLKTVRRNLL
ncbi:autotransporter outer membrane beta-barrel domain-containing protein [Endozoicomonas sp. 8E]|uniref:autotransporter family protein n=1 Tax=Endozoicomonas sp. 8E TaxID=3035692 RepID=UPI002939052D|nr:autotransporter outer membrane beta-barrel domain-containing protein [Endozoicomonas sp. 8E]WOG27782.1 autotransporter outer membrane beta-barrel domain-containing protein [Endozoicomonas sp. 8E]